jgi:hypothetical protein
MVKLCISHLMNSIFFSTAWIIDRLASRNKPSNALSTTTQSSSAPAAMSSKSKPRSKKSSKGGSLLSLLLCCTFGSGSLLDDKDGSRGGDRSDSEPETERVLDRPTNQADSVVTAASTIPPQLVSNRDELHTAPAQESGAPADAPIPLRPMTVGFFLGVGLCPSHTIYYVHHLLCF